MSCSRPTAIIQKNCCRSATGLDFGLRAAMTEVRSGESTVQTGSFLGREEKHFYRRTTQKNQPLTFAAFFPHTQRTANLFTPLLPHSDAKLASFCLLPKNTTPGLSALERLVLSLSCSCIKRTFCFFPLLFFSLLSFGPSLKIKSLTCRW